MVASSSAKVAAAALAAVLVVASPAYAGPSNKRRARVAVRHIISQQKNNGSFPAFSPVGSTADAVVAMVAARRAPGRIDRALDYLSRRVRKGNVSGVGETAKVVMAAVAGGRNPKRFGRRNLVWAIKQTETSDGRYGETTAVFDHALGLLAVAGAKAGPTEEAAAWLAAAQCGDGGWQYDEAPGPADDEHCAGGEGDFFSSDTNTTAIAVQALEASGGSSAPAADPFAFFAAVRDEQFGGWGFSSTFSTTDTNSTALVLQAYAAAGEDVPLGAGRALKRLQYRLCNDTRGGAFAVTWNERGDGFVRSGPDVGATIAGVLGLLRVPLPVAPANVTKAPPRRRGC